MLLQTSEFLVHLPYRTREHFRALPVTARDLFEVARDNGLLLALWGGRSNLSAQQRLGHALSARRDRVFGAYMLRLSTSPGETGNLAYYLELHEEGRADLKTPKTPKTPITPEDVAGEGNNEGGVLGDTTTKTPSETPQNPPPPR